MPRWALDVVIIASLGSWLLSCLGLYRRMRHARWLAAASVSSCLGLLGLTVAVSFEVHGALALLPLWTGLGLTAVHHLQWATDAVAAPPRAPGSATRGCEPSAGSRPFI